MNKEELIEQFQNELESLGRQVLEQQQKIDELQQKLHILTGGEPAIKKPVSTTRTGESHKLENFIGLRLIHFIGIIVLVIGLSIGVKYAIDQDLISQKMRIGLAYMAAALLFILSFRLKKKYEVFSAILFSGSMASFYFNTYAAFVYYNMFSAAISFLIMIILTMFTIYQAISYNRQEIALLGLVGAYAIPFLISKNADRADLFFSYIFLINTGVIFLSVFKNWKWVARIANIISWILFIGWAIMRFNPKWQTTGFVFLCLYFLLFLFASLGSRIIHKKSLSISDTYFALVNNLSLYIGTLYIFGSGFSQSGLAQITLSLFFIAISELFAFYYFWRTELLLRNFLTNYSLILLVSFIAFEWSGLTVTLLWLLTAVVLFIYGVRSSYVPVRLASMVLMGATLLKLIIIDSLTFSTIQKIISYLVLGVLLLFVSFFYQKFRQQLFGEDKERGRMDG